MADSTFLKSIKASRATANCKRYEKQKMGAIYRTISKQRNSVKKIKKEGHNQRSSNMIFKRKA
jgi:hypothetical protein